VRTYHCVKNLTLSVDAQVVELAREAARQRGISLDTLIRQYIESSAGRRSGPEIVRELERQWARSEAHSGGRKIQCEEAYEGRLG
jgi:hypothetical protein